MIKERADNATIMGFMTILEGDFEILEIIKIQEINLFWCSF